MMMIKYLAETRLSRAMISSKWMPIAYVQSMSEQFEGCPEYYEGTQFRADSFNNYPRIVSNEKFDELFEAIFWLRVYKAISQEDFDRAKDLMSQIESIIKKIPYHPGAFDEPSDPENATGG